MNPDVMTLMQLPWTLRIADAEDGGRMATIEELPEFVAAGDTDEELDQAIWDSLAALMESYVKANQMPTRIPTVTPIMPKLTKGEGVPKSWTSAPSGNPVLAAVS